MADPVVVARGPSQRARRARKRPGAGRPTREQARQRHDELLDTALDHFLDRGYEQATIDAIAASVGMTKRTVYARYPDKAALFRASVQRAIEQLIVPHATLAALESGDLEATLTAVARSRVAQVMTPAGLKLQRIINTESYRFPEIFTMSYEQGTRPVIEFLAALLRRETDAGRLSATDPVMAATVFMSMVVGGPVRMIVSGQRLPSRQIEARLAFAVQLFLDGARARRVELRPREVRS
ncbi:MAG TPA: TetR/AcrR family transcriptional regulator [Myxococcota bacterium]|nr:TetR/AcrR family transcriptional regulator [Myxococcota bacterium]